METKIDPVDPKEWLLERLKVHKFDYDYKTDALKHGDSIVEEPLAIAILRLDAKKQDEEGLRAYIRDALNIVRYEKSKLELDKLRSLVSHNPIPDDLVANWVTAVCGQGSKLDITAIKHFIWQAKRKLFGLPVEHHLMPILWGRSGIGKSVAVSQLISPLKMVALQTDMGIFEDQFSRRAFARNFIVFFDELPGSEHADVNAIKQIITAPVIEWRAMRSERTMCAPQNTTFIGCSNEPVRERIKDTTSSRRFWQVNCADQIDWNSINSIDYLTLWKSIDENSPSPLVPFLNEIRKVQESEIRVRNILEQWIEEKCEVVTFNESSLTTSEAYHAFCDYSLSQDHKSVPQFQKFARDLKRILAMLGKGDLSKKSNRGTIWCIKVKSQAVSVNEGSDGSEGQLEFNFDAA